MKFLVLWNSVFSFYSQVPILWYSPLAIPTEYSLTPFEHQRGRGLNAFCGSFCCLWWRHIPESTGCFSPNGFPGAEPTTTLQASGLSLHYWEKGLQGGRWALRVKAMHVNIFHPSPKHSRASLRSKAGQLALRKRMHELNFITGLITWAH